MLVSENVSTFTAQINTKNIMRKSLSLFLAIFSSVALYAQEFRPAVDMYFLGNVMHSGTDVTYRFSFDYRVNEQLRVGPGIGYGLQEYSADVEGEEFTQCVAGMPLFVNVKWVMAPSDRFSFLFKGDIGYSFKKDVDDWTTNSRRRYRDDLIDVLGPTAGVAAGLNLGRFKGSWQFSAMVRLQCIDWDRASDDFSADVLAGISVGYTWGR